jgi:hypothetical protein
MRDQLADSEIQWNVACETRRQDEPGADLQASAGRIVRLPGLWGELDRWRSHDCRGHPVDLKISRKGV